MSVSLSYLEVCSMREIKDSGIEWIGEIPDDWKIFHFKYIVKEKIDNRGRTPEIDENDIGIPIIELDAIGNKNPDVEKASKFISEESYKKYIRKGLKSGDVLFGTVGSIGKCSIVPNEFNYCIAQNIVGYRFNNDQDSLFWYYYFKSEPFKHMYMQFNKGNIQNSIKISNMERGVLVIPPLKEQQRIANFLDEKCGEIDSLTKDIQEQIATLEKYKKSVITETVTKGLNPSIKAKSTDNKYWENIPVNWELSDIKYLFEIVKRIAGKEGYDILSVTQKGLKIKDISKNEGQIAESYANYQFVYPTDFVMNHMDLLTGWVDCSKYFGVTSPDYRVFRLRDTKNNLNYYKYVMQSCYMNKIFYSLGQGVSNLGRWRLQTSTFNNFKIPVPPSDEQQQIADYLDSKCSEIDAIIQTKKEQLDVLAEYKKSLIYEYVTGKKEVPVNE